MRRLILRSLVVVASIASTACGSRTGELMGQYGDDDGGSGHGQGGDDNGGGSGQDAGPTDYTSAQVQAALARCDLSHGPAVNVTDGDDETANLVGTWIQCPASSDAAPPTLFAPAIRLDADGKFETLMPDGDGGLTLAMGVQSQGAWSVGCEESSSISNSQPCPEVVVSLRTVGDDLTPAGCYGGPISFESSPRRMYVDDEPQEYCDVQYTGAAFDLWLVTLP